MLFHFVVLGCLAIFNPFQSLYWHIGLSKSESLPAQRDGKFTVGMTQILLTHILAVMQAFYNVTKRHFSLVCF